MDAVDGEFAQLMGLFAAWRAELDAEPFAYSNEDLLRAYAPSLFGGEPAEPPTDPDAMPT